MSTKIYNAYITDKSLSELLLIFNSLAIECEELKLNLLRQSMTGISSDEYYGLAMKARDDHNNDIINNLDFQLEVVIFEVKNKRLLMLFGNKEIMKFAISKMPFITDFHYQYFTDKPDNITKKEWRKREKFWNKAIPTGRPSSHGFVFELSKFDLPYYFSLNGNR